MDIKLLVEEIILNTTLGRIGFKDMAIFLLVKEGEAFLEHILDIDNSNEIISN